MAVSKMKKMTLIVHKGEKGKIFKKLTQLGTVEIIDAITVDELKIQSKLDVKQEIEKKIQKLDFVFNFLLSTSKEINFENNKEYKEKKKNTKGKVKKDFSKIKVNLGKENRLVAYEELESYLESEYELFTEISELEAANSRLVEIKNKQGQLKSLINNIKKYESVDVRFSDVNETRFCSMFLGTIDSNFVNQIDLGENVYISHSVLEKETLIFVVAHKNDKTRVAKILEQHAFQPCPYNDKLTAKEKIDEIKLEQIKMQAEREEILKRTISAMDNLSLYKGIYDFYILEREKQIAIENSLQTSQTIIIETWVPTNRAEFTEKEIKDISKNAVVFIEEPSKDDVIPSYLVNNKLVSPFEKNITSMYGAPKYGSVDPNPFVAFFYILFFGFMLGDVGYGAVLVVACAIFLLVKKPVKDSGSFIKMFMLCGIACIAWGIVFGSYFGLEEHVFKATKLGTALLKLKKLDALGAGSIVIFGIALLLGAIQIVTGFTLNFVQKVKDRQLIDGLFNDLSWVVIFLGLGLYLLNNVAKVAALKTAGMVVAIIGVAMLLIGGALGKKNPISMIVGGFKNLYGSVNVLSDILSYSRLFGLSLTTGVIALVFNKIGIIIKDMVGGGFIGYIFAVIIWLVGHAFNFGINILGVYVHNSRLQYVEFFGKFYSGEGHAFVPFGSKTRFTYLEDKLVVPKEKKIKK